MAINITMPQPRAIPMDPTIVADPKKNEKQLKQLQKEKKEIDKTKKEIEKGIKTINKDLEDAFGKSAKSICLLRLDLVADMLQRINPKLARELDAVTDDLEKVI